MDAIRAAVLEEFGRPLALQELPLPALRDGETLVRIRSSGVCGSDVHMFSGADPRLKLPLVLGHESLGVIERLAGRVRAVDGTELKVGDLIAWDRGIYCGCCRFCRAGSEHLCPSRKAYGIHYGGSRPPEPAGGYATHIVLKPGTRIFKLPESAAASARGLVSCACSGATAVHSVEVASPQAGELAVVMGAGPLGLWTVALIAARGARVVAIGRRKKRLDMALELGAMRVLDESATTTAERFDEVLALSGASGADLVIDTTASIEAAGEAISLLRPGGRYVNSGAAVPAGLLHLRPYEDLVRREISLHGAWVSGTAHLQKALEFALERPDAISRMVTHVFPLERAGEALETVSKDRSAVKVVLEP